MESVRPSTARFETLFSNDRLCLIRSGQDWSDTDGGERRMYLNEVEPVLRADMDFLRDEGRTVGCYANRYLRVIDERGDPLGKSFGMSWLRSLADLDRWAKDHPTHKAIFGQAMKYLSTMGPAIHGRLIRSGLDHPCSSVNVPIDGPA